MARVLVVDDDRPSRRLLSDLFRYRGHEVLEAATVRDAIALLAGPAPDVALLDVRVPGGGGRVVLAEIRGRPPLARLPVLAVTAFAMRGDRERLLREGFDDYVSKPFDMDVLIGQVEGLIASRTGAVGG